MKIKGFDKEITVYSGVGQESVKMYRGNFNIKDKTVSRSKVSGTGYEINTSEDNGIITIHGKSSDPNVNRTWIRISANPEEHIVGGGEQFSFLDLRGRKYPIWTREQGIGRNKHRLLTILADISDKAGGDYYTTFYPQPTFMSSELYFAHFANYEYSCLDFTHKSYHEICIWTNEFELKIGTGNSYYELLNKLTGLLGRQKSLPEWAVRGIWLGAQGGTETVLGRLADCEKGGIDIPVIWIQDWEGKRITSFGKRLQWDWRWSEETYPNLDKIIAGDTKHRWMGYINPQLVEDGLLFNEAEKLDYFIKRPDGSNYVFDFGEFNCAMVDLTNPDAYEWFKNVIKKNLIEMGFRGWMADFGEYLPFDAVCHGGTGNKCHNIWPMLWAKCNREAIQETGMENECVFFTRAGASGTQKYSTLMWAGDQNVDFSADDGLPSVITAALSLGMSGYGLHTSDCGGYTTVLNVKRSEELLLRWLEYSCFTPVMRTHEGNRPESNIQLYSNERTINAGVYWAKVHNRLSQYILDCMKENERNGIPVQRPLFLDDPGKDEYYRRNLFEYFFGPEILVAPVVKKGATSRKVYIPKGEWIHLWTGEKYTEGKYKINSPIGKPPVFYRSNETNSQRFSNIATLQ